MKLRTRLAVLAILWIVTIALARLLVNTPYEPTPTGYAVGAAVPASSTGKLDFRTMTVAICDKNASASVRCRNEIKVVCGDEEYLLPQESRQITCGNLKMSVPSITSFDVFDKDWKDLRYS